MCISVNFCQWDITRMYKPHQVFPFKAGGLCSLIQEFGTSHCELVAAMCMRPTDYEMVGKQDRTPRSGTMLEMRALTRPRPSAYLRTIIWGRIVLPYFVLCSFYYKNLAFNLKYTSKYFSVKVWLIMLRTLFEFVTMHIEMKTMYIILYIVTLNEANKPQMQYSNIIINFFGH